MDRAEEVATQDKKNQWSNSRNPGANPEMSAYEHLCWLKQKLNVRKGTRRVDWVSTAKGLTARPRNRYFFVK